MRRAVSTASGRRGVHAAALRTAILPLRPTPAVAFDRSVGASSAAAGFHAKSGDAYSEALGTAAKTTKLPVGAAAAEPAPPPSRRRTVSVADIAERRVKAGRLVAGTAAYSDTDMFKGPVSTTLTL